MLCYIFCLQNLVMCSSEERSFFLCTRSDISNFSRQNYKKYEMIGIDNYNWKYPIFGSAKKDFHINKISYMIKPNENLHLSAMNYNDEHVLDILIPQDENSVDKETRNIEFFEPNSNNGMESIKFESFKCIEGFNNDVYVVENNYDIRFKMQLALEYIQLSNEISDITKKNYDVFQFIKTTLNLSENEKTYNELHWKLQILFFVISESKLADPFNNLLVNQNEDEKNFIVFNNQIVENKIIYNINIIEKIVCLIDELEVFIKNESLFKSNDNLLDTMGEIKLRLKLAKQGFSNLFTKIKDLDGEDFNPEVMVKSLAAMFTLELINIYLNFQKNYNDLVFKCRQSNENNLNFSNFEEMLKIFLIFQNERSLTPPKKLKRTVTRC